MLKKLKVISIILLLNILLQNSIGIFYYIVRAETTNFTLNTIQEVIANEVNNENQKFQSNQVEVTANNTTNQIVSKDKKEDSKTVLVEYSPYIDGNQKITKVEVIIKTQDEIEAVSGWEYVLNSKKEIVKTYTQNTQESITIKEVTGKESKVEISIENIGFKITGDINIDGRVNMIDFLDELRNIAAEKDEKILQEYKDWKLDGISRIAADVDKDGNIDVTDVYKILCHVAAQKDPSIAEKHPDWIIQLEGNKEGKDENQTQENNSSQEQNTQENNILGEELLKVAKECWMWVYENIDAYGASSVPPKDTIDSSTYVTWVLYEMGYKEFDHQWTTRDFLAQKDILKAKYGWEIIEIGHLQDISNIVQPGDIIDRADLEKQKGHINIAVSCENGKLMAYDCGSSNNWKNSGGNPIDKSNFLIDQYHANKGQSTAGIIIRGVKRITTQNENTTVNDNTTKDNNTIANNNTTKNNNTIADNNTTKNDTTTNNNATTQKNEGQDILEVADKCWKWIYKNIKNYGGCSIPPKKTVDCSGFVTWVLYEMGYKEFNHQWTTRDFMRKRNILKAKYGWEIINIKHLQNISNIVKSGDIIDRVDLKKEKGHMNIAVSCENGKLMAYDCGSSKNWKNSGGKPIDRSYFLIDRYHANKGQSTAGIIIRGVKLRK